ncbi:MAG: Gfo/Idh/MocA family oxidoreductase [Phycisphaerae bacterium]|nr:Gfo/Idh/MocA family oxidoreductase [Phycisphaerae bacterium]
MRNGKPLRFAVIGCGVVSEYGHLPTISALAGKAELVAVADVDETALGKAKAVYPHAKACTDYRQALRENVDVVTVATRTDTHVEIALAAFDVGAHVMLEKPPATTLADAQRLLDAQRQHAGRICAVNFILRYHTGNRQIKQWIDAGEIGRVRAIHIVDAWFGADHRGRFVDRAARILKDDGSVIVAEGIHQADLIRWLGGSDFGAIHCLGTCVHHGPHQDYQVLTSLLRNGVVASLESSWAYAVKSKDGALDRQVDVIGEEGAIKWNESLGKITLLGRDKTVETQAADDKHFHDIYEDLLASIHAGNPVANLPTLEDSVHAMAAVTRAHQAAYGDGVA